jgi:hypothetical protein
LYCRAAFRWNKYFCFRRRSDDDEEIVATLLTQHVCFLDSGEVESTEKNVGVCRST